MIDIPDSIYPDGKDFIMEEFTKETMEHLTNRFQEIKEHFGEWIGKAFEDAIKTDFAYGESSLPLAEKTTEELISMTYTAKKAWGDKSLDDEIRTKACLLYDRLYPIMRQAYVIRDTYVNDAFDGNYGKYRESLKRDMQISIDISCQPSIDNKYMGAGKIVCNGKTELFGFEQIESSILLGQGDTLYYEDQDLTGLISEYKDEIRKAITERIENEKTKTKEEKPEKEDIEEEYER